MKDTHNISLKQGETLNNELRIEHWTYIGKLLILRLISRSNFEASFEWQPSDNKIKFMTIIGNKFLVDFGMARAILNFQSETSLTFSIIEKNGTPTNETETVAIKLTEIRQGLFMATWKELNGNTVTQIQDYVKEKIYSNWTSPNGDFTNIEGTIKPLI